MNVLIDYHHTDLAESLHKLFEDRLGMNVYVPDGMEWFEQGVWRQGHELFGDAIARQFLLAPTIDNLNPLRKLRRLKLEEAQAMDWAVVVASVPDNYDGYAKFAKVHDARFAIQVGNVSQWIDMRLDPVVLDSTGQYGAGVAFTPEFDIEGAFRYAPPLTRAKAASAHGFASFVNLFPKLPCYPLMEAAAAALPSDWVKPLVYGHDGPSGFVKPTATIGQFMRQVAFGWHDKITGDGFGYVIHYWASVGRPLIGHASHYLNQTAGDLWDDLVTCIDLDKHSPEEAAGLMDDIVRNPDRHAEMCHTIAQRVRARIDFAQDAARVADALGVSAIREPVAA